MDRLEKLAKELDSKDKLNKFKSEFIYPDDKLYFDGNSLGMLSKQTKETLKKVINDEWGQNLISSWNNSWINLPNKVSKKISKILNSNEAEIYVGGTTSLNLYKLLLSLIKRKNSIINISTDNLNFPSDKYICEGICNDYNLKFNLLEYDNYLPDVDLLEQFIKNNKGIIVLSLVTYKSSYRYPVKKINRICQENDSIVIWDLSHAIGAIDIDMKINDIDFAIGCTYKYLNGGPGSPAFIYVRPDLIKKCYPILRGWLGHKAPFDFTNTFEKSASIAMMRVGTPPVIQTAILEKALDIFQGINFYELREESIKLSDLLIKMVEQKCPDLHLESPINSSDRGSQVSFSHPSGYAIMQALIDRNIVGDFRAPNIIRFGITPLYINEDDIIQTVKVLREILSNRLWENPIYLNRKKVT